MNSHLPLFGFKLLITLLILNSKSSFDSLSLTIFVNSCFILAKIFSKFDGDNLFNKLFIIFSYFSLFVLISFLNTVFFILQISFGDCLCFCLCLILMLLLYFSFFLRFHLKKFYHLTCLNLKLIMLVEF